MAEGLSDDVLVILRRGCCLLDCLLGGHGNSGGMGQIKERGQMSGVTIIAFFVGVVIGAAVVAAVFAGIIDGWFNN